MMIIFRNSIQDGMKFYCLCQKIHQNDILECPHKLRKRESDQLTNVLELYDMEIHQKISMPNYQKLKTMVKRRRDQKLQLLTPDTGEFNQDQWSRIERD